MDSSQNIQGLEWLVNEVDTSMAEADQALENFQADPEDTGSLRFCLSHIHQVTGSLKMAECFGGVLLSKELESVVNGLQIGAVATTSENIMALRQAIMEVPHYLRSTIASRLDQPAVLITQLNDLRALRQQALASECPFFGPDLDALGALPVVNQRPDDEAGQALDEKLLRNYEASLLALMKGGGEPKALDRLAKVLARLERAHNGTQLALLWQVAGAVIDALSGGAIKTGVALRTLFKELGDCLRGLVRCQSVGDFDFPDALFKNLLYYAAVAAEGDSARLLKVRKMFDLHNALPAGKLARSEGGLLPNYEQPVVEALASALEKAILACHQHLDELRMNGDATRQGEVLARLQLITDTFAMIGQSRLLRLSQELSAGLPADAKVDELSTTDLAALSDRLLDMANLVRGWADTYTQGALITDDVAETTYVMNDAQHSLIREGRNNLEAIKEAIVGFISSQWDDKFLQDIPAQIADVAAAIRVVKLSRPARIIGVLGEFVVDKLVAAAEPPSWDQLNLLADALTSIEYFLEAVGNNSTVDQTNWLNIAEQALTQLGYGAIFSEATSALADDKNALPPGKTTDVVESTGGDDQSNATEAGDAAQVTPSTIDTKEAEQESVEDEEIDAEIIEIFVEEAREIMDTLADCYWSWLDNREDKEMLGVTRRSFHSLKGSGRMVNANDIGELGYAAEKLFNKVIESNLEFTDDCQALIAKVLEILPAMVDAFAERRPTAESCPFEQLIEIAEQLIRGETLTSEWQQLLTEEQASTDIAEQDVSEHALEDQSLLEIFAEEADGHIQGFRAFVASLRGLLGSAIAQPVDDILRSMHMLKGSANVVGKPALAGVAGGLETVVQTVVNNQLAVDAKLIDLLEESIEHINREVMSLSGDVAAEHAEDTILAERLHTLATSLQTDNGQAGSRGVLKELLASGLSHVLDGPAVIALWRDKTPEKSPALNSLVNELMGLAEAAKAANENDLEQLAGYYAGALEAAHNGRFAFDDNAYELFADAHQHLLDMLDSIAVNQRASGANSQLVIKLREMAQLEPEVVVSGQEQQRAEPEVFDQSPERATGEIEAQVSGAVTDLPDEDIEPEVIAIFIEEAEELLEQIDGSIQAWRDNPKERVHRENMCRALHTFKGGARVAGFMATGEKSHDFETFLEVRRTIETEDEAFFNEVFQRYDELVSLFEQIRKYGTTGAPGAVIASEMTGDPAISNEVETPLVPPGDPEKVIPPAANPPQPAAGLSRPMGQVIPFASRPAGPATAAGKVAATASAEPQEMVKISAPALDTLVNLAGETSITRGRVEQKIQEFSHSLDEMETTVFRLQDQIRRLGIETEAQMLFRKEQIQALDDLDGFDPLELDRYSQLQQLSRSLHESASDLKEVKDSLLDKSRSAETLLLQQAQINTDLQESLMLTRMVPFSRLVPRLRRVVRQVSNELDKPVKLQLKNVEGEMDRSVLGKIVGPLEHMIRNAVDHGIEDAATRKEFGKAKEGNIFLTFSREGGEVIISVADDGKGLDVDAIRKRALERGLIDEQTTAREQELMQMIFLPGFSTSETVSQVSGRGVGLDVVANEVRQMGGAIAISSKPGLGTEFNIRLPFTVSINSALMIRNKADLYALPLNTIVGVVKITAEDLLECYTDRMRKLQYGGSDYRPVYLGNLLGEHSGRPVLATGSKAALVLVATENHRYAIHVDGLEGSQEIVVKGLGPHFSKVSGISGVTVMGDGEVVVILDLLALLRAQGALESLIEGQVLAFEQEHSDRVLEKQVSAPAGLAARTVMVVDDSVTVRKVTSRFLERQGFRVVTAKDGVDALDLLNREKPDIMLLDIEMPRMDGFEVARIVRNTSATSELPIIMISSRSAEKHQTKAFACGVDEFLSKPYQEDHLLTSIQELLAG